MRKEVNLEFGNFKIFEHYIISTINEGVLLDESLKVEIWEVCKKYFKDEPFGYISNRINSYSVNPTIYLQDSEYFSKLKAMAMVSDRDLHRSNFQLERQFFKAEFELFDTIPEAEKWIRDILSYSNSSSPST